MPTAHAQDGFDVVIYPDDHAPPHVHVKKAGAEIKIILGDVDTGPHLGENYGMSRKDARKALMVVSAHQAKLLDAWKEYRADA